MFSTKRNPLVIDRRDLRLDKVYFKKNKNIEAFYEPLYEKPQEVDPLAELRKDFIKMLLESSDFIVEYGGPGFIAGEGESNNGSGE